MQQSPNIYEWIIHRVDTSMMQYQSAKKYTLPLATQVANVSYLKVQTSEGISKLSHFWLPSPHKLTKYYVPETLGAAMANVAATIWAENFMVRVYVVESS